MVGYEQIEQWRSQLKDEPSSFARDLANVLLLELERLQADPACERRFAATQAAVIRAQLAVSPPECAACGDGALRRVEERMRLFGTVRASAITVPATAVLRPRFS